MDQYQKDITVQFFESCKSCLSPGEVAHEIMFGLHHAMSAIDIMNPSMDAGMSKERKVIFLQDAIDNGSLFLTRFTDLSTILGIFDELIVLFVNWITGDSLVQTVYTCMYMHCIPLIEDPRLAVFCETLRRVIVGFRRLLLTMPVFEEEDFCPLTNGVPLHFDTKKSFSERKAVNSLFDLSYENIIKLLEKEENDLTESSSDSFEMRSALHDRLKFMRLMLTFVLRFSFFVSAVFESDLDESRDAPDFAGFGSVSSFHRSPSLERMDMSSASFNIACDKAIETSTDLTEICKSVLKTSEYGRKAGLGKQFPRTESFDLPGFEPFLTQAFLPSTVQRFPRNLSRSAAFSFLMCAFCRVKTIIQAMKSLYSSNPQHVVHFCDLWTLVHSFGHNFCHPLYKDTELSTALAVEDACSKSCALSRGILCIVMSAVVQCPLNLHERFLSALDLSTPAMHFLTSWISIECTRNRNCLLDNASVLNQYGSFFEHANSQLLTICRGYAFNRSRQRSNMERLFCRMHELLEDSCSIEGSLVVELTEKQPSLTDPPITLHLAAYICFFYYHLVWDYVATGFHLELYSCYEWVYAYAFIITIQRSLSSLLAHILKELCCEDDGDQGASNPANQASNSAATGRRRRRGKQANAVVGKPADNGASTDTKSPPLPPLSSLLTLPVMAQSNVHRFMCAATVYVMRALHRDLGIDLDGLNAPRTSPSDGATSGSRRNFYCSLKTQFYHRLAPVISAPSSPLAESGGPAVTLQTTHDYLVGRTFADPPTGELYQMASKVYGVVRQWIKTAETLGSPSTHLGPVDTLAQLDHVAKNNDIVCRLLAARPEKRPKPPEPNPRAKWPNLVTDAIPVHLDFTYLPSRVYPLLRLA
ncbi:unnamed protein product [Mesocestoides corti]|uniref:Protein MAK10 homolog n=1 Tax=Mesocestoides corti TaxID=53468 RepID=A0A0R3U3A7_MESCO|nr:unnamed protein product [Mesocestoides corti]